MRTTFIQNVPFKAALVAGAVVLLALVGGVANGDIDTGLVGYYPCEEGEGDGSRAAW